MNAGRRMGLLQNAIMIENNWGFILFAKGRMIKNSGKQKKGKSTTIKIYTNAKDFHFVDIQVWG